MIRLIYILFSLSGFSGLIYESLWARYLKLFLGHSAYGQILTLCIYMGGLGIGSFAGACFAKKSRNPLFLYGLIELIVAVGGFAFHPLYLLATNGFYQADFLSNLPSLLIVTIKVVLSISITCPIAVLLGMTFPCLAIGVMRLTEDEGRASLPLLYFSNSIGAAIGITAASYLLIPTLGTAGSLAFAASLNSAIGTSFLFIGRSITKSQDVIISFEEKGRNVPVGILSDSVVIFWLLVSMVTGFSSFLYEIGWIRLLSLVMGSSTHAFDIMVSAFILGLACGGLYARRLLRKSGREGFALGVIQIAMGLAALCTIYGYKPFFMAMNRAHVLFPLDSLGYFLMSSLKYSLCLGMMFPACFFAGMTLPIITFILTKEKRNEIHTGTVYGFNTIGAILGSVLGGLVLLPLMQLKMTIASGAIIDILLGLVIFSRYPVPRKQRLIAYAAAALAIIPVFFVQFNRNVLAAGQFRHRTLLNKQTLVAVRDGSTATISFHIDDGLLALKSNGKSDASLSPGVTGKREDDEYTQSAIAFIPMACMNKPYDAAMIGMGSGMTAHHLLADSLVRRLDIVEIEREVFHLSKGFLPYNDRAYNDPRAVQIVDDAKTFFHVNKKRYDMIISEPSNPWVSGVSGLFTSEFYQRIQTFLTDDGLLVQWMHLYEFDSNLMLSILKTLAGVFPQIQIFRVPQGSDIVILAWKHNSRPMMMDRFVWSSEIKKDLDKLRVAPDFFGIQNYIVTNRTLKPLLDLAPMNSDFYPVVDNGAEKAFYLDDRVELFDFFTGNCVYYQEIIEPDIFMPALPAIQRLKISQSLMDAAAMKALIIDLKISGPTSNWERIDKDFYLAIFDYMGTPKWDSLEAIPLYRSRVDSLIPPANICTRFKLFDCASHGKHDEAEALVRMMVKQYPIDQAGEFLIRTMAIEALRSGDTGLCRQVYEIFTKNNRELNAYERLFLRAVLTKNHHKRA